MPMPTYIPDAAAAESPPRADTPAGPVVYSLDVEMVSDAELVSLVCLQGLANRDSSRVFLTLRQRQCHSSFMCNPLSDDHAAQLSAETLSLHRSAPEFWQRYYGRRHGFQFRLLRHARELFDVLGGVVRGIVRFRLSNRCELPLAVTLAGVEDAIAVPDESPLLDELLARWPVVADVRDRFCSRLEASQWGLKNLMPRCTHRAVFSQNDTNRQRDPDIFSLDLAVRERMFVFNLDFWQALRPDHFALIRQILAQLEPMSPMYGWGTNEAAMMVAMGPSGSFLICTGCPNLSFHKGVPGPAQPLRTRRRFDPRAVRVEDRHYVAFMVNEGDTLKWMGSVMGAGRWLESHRQDMPVSWGVSPFINEQYPGLMEYFYESSGAGDVFVSSISGYGYYGFKHCARALELADREAGMLKAMDVSVGSLYSVHGMLDAVHGALDPATDAWLARRGCRGYMFESAQQQEVWFTSAGQPLLGADWSLFYWNFRIPGEGAAQLRGVAQRIRELARGKMRPALIPVYGGSPSDFARIRAELPEDEFKIVGLDEMVEVARLIGPRPRAPRLPRAPSPRPFAGRVLSAPRGAESFSPPLTLDLASRGVGCMRADLRFAWDDACLRVRVEERDGPREPCESWQQAGYAAGEFDLTDGVALWFDFDLDGTREHGDYTLWLGFSSRGRNDLWCCTLNNRVLTSVHPAVRAITTGAPGTRAIDASIAWRDLEQWLEADHQPAPCLTACVGPGFTFGCQPLLVEGRAGRAFLNGRSNRRENDTAVVLEDQRRPAGHAFPDGFDAASLRVELV